MQFCCECIMSNRCMKVNITSNVILLHKLCFISNFYVRGQSIYLLLPIIQQNKTSPEYKLVNRCLCSGRKIVFSIWIQSTTNFSYKGNNIRLWSNNTDHFRNGTSSFRIQLGTFFNPCIDLLISNLSNCSLNPYALKFILCC